MDRESRLHITPQFVVGLLLVTFGVLLTLDRIDGFAAALALRFWPVVFIVLGLYVLVDRRDSRGRTWGGVLVAIGVWLLLNTFGVVRASIWDLFWPAILILVGLRLIGRPGWRREALPPGASGRRADAGDAAASFVAGAAPPTAAPGAAPASASAPVSPDGWVSLFAILGSTRRALAGPFHGGEMTAFMGGCQLDLRQASLDPAHPATVNVFAVMGGNDITVPAGWSIVSEVIPVLGGVDDKRIAAAPVAADAATASPRLIIRGFVMMGGLVIKN
jgi:hypothetical protein